LLKRNGLPEYFLALLGWLVSCAPAYKQYVSSYRFEHKSTVPDYAQLQYWAANPGKHNPSDSVPLPLRPTSSKDSGIDVFFLHPTTFTDPVDGAWNADINNPVLNARTDYSTILYQASVFNECRVFAPRYRQAHISVYYSPDTMDARAALDLAYEDLRTAFQYYLDHDNHGRPIIIASHSQGSTHAERLLKEFFENKPLQSKLVVAYVVGMAIPKGYFTTLPACQDSSQTGCFVGWRSFREGYEPGFVIRENGNSFVTNPLTWTTTYEYAPASLNQGAILTKFNVMREQVADAQIHGDVLWLHKPHFPGSVFYKSRNYHIGDINLFYLNIRQNVQTRIRAFRKNH
jgi:hypothetical protein